MGEVSNTDKVRLIELPKIEDERGNLSFIENGPDLPFEIKRTFWTYDVPGGERRGGHAYHSACELIIALSGSFDIVVTSKDDRRTTYSLNRSYYGLLVPANNWRHLENFSTNALAITLSSTIYDEADYIRDFNDYRLIKNA